MEDEGFLARWSRLKQAAQHGEKLAAPAAAAAGDTLPASAAAPASVELPALEALDFTSDFSAFLQPRIEEGLRRAALKKLFHSEHFNKMDGLDVYIDDYNNFDAIPEDMLRELTQARELLFGEHDGAAQPTADASQPPAVPAESTDAAADVAADASATTTPAGASRT